MMNKRFEFVAESENFVVEYNKDLNVYRVSYFEDNHYVDEVHFDGVEPVNEVTEEAKSEREIREMMYSMCNRVTCEKCPLRTNHGERTPDCPNFLELYGTDLNKTYEIMKNALKKNSPHEDSND